MALKDYKKEDLAKLKALWSHKIDVTLVWGARHAYDSYSDLMGFRVFGLLDPKEWFGTPDCGVISLASRHELILLLEVLSKFGERFSITIQFEDSYRKTKIQHEIGWRVSSSLLLTVLRLLGHDNPHLEEIIRLAKSEKHFLALSAVAEEKFGIVGEEKN